MTRTLAIALMIFAGPAIAADQVRIDRLARDVARVEAVRAVKALQLGLAQDIEAGRWNDAAARFAADAVVSWDGGAGTVRGRAVGSDLRRRFDVDAAGKPRNLHAQLMLAPIITLSADGRTAKGRWHEVSMLGRVGGEAGWTGGILENDYALGRDGRWRIARMIYHPVFRGPYDTGWRNVDTDEAPVPMHYRASEVGRPATLGDAAPAPPAGAAAGRIAGRIDRLLDADAVANLQNAYGYYLDRKMWDDVADLFDDPASQTARAAAGPLAEGELNDHIQANLLVCVARDGTRAHARGLDVGMIGRNEGDARWSLALFDTDFVKRDGRWRIAAMRVTPRMTADYRRGFAQADYARPAAERAFDCEEDSAAGRPPSDDAAIARAEQHLAQAAGRDAVEHLTSAFGNYIDDFQWDDLGSLFAPDGKREAPGVGFYVGPERITRMQRTRYGDYKGPRTSIPIHTMTQPVTHVSEKGGSAKSRTRLLQFNTALDRPGSMMAGIYENEAVLIDGVWKFRTVEIDHTLQTATYADGWTRIPDGLGQRMIPPARKLLEEYPPDSPNVGEIYAPYPARGLMWFHYDNPVSGRAPPLKTPKTAAVISRRTGGNGQ